MRTKALGGRNGSSHTSTVLVTGGAGYIGSLLVRRLLKLGYRVRVLDRLVYGDAGLRGVLSHPHIELIVADFRDNSVVMKATDSVDAIIHLGAIVGDAACALDEELATTTNVDATALLADVSRQQGIARYIFISTCSVYGASDKSLDESSALNPVSHYARNKIAAERLLLERSDLAFAPVILRLGTAYGLSPRPRFDLVVNLLTAQAVTEEKASIHGGTQWRPFIHVDDISRAIVMALEAPLDAVRGQILNVGANAHNYQLRELGTLIGEEVPDAELVTLDNVVDLRNYYVCFDKVEHILGFYPTHNLRDGIREIKFALDSGRVSEFRASQHHNHLWLRDFPSQPRQAPIRLSSPSAVLAALVGN